MTLSLPCMHAFLYCLFNTRYVAQAPYYTIRAEAWQARVMQAASSYFLPAEMADLQRIGIRFVPQEADRIKRHLRRKDDYYNEASNPTLPAPDDGPDHPAFRDNNQRRRQAAENTAGDINPTLGRAPAGNRIRRVIPNQDNSGFPQDGQLAAANTRQYLDQDGNQINPVNNPPRRPAPNSWVRTANSNSLLRRTQLFIGSVFVFDLAHALLRHLRQEVISLTANGTEADESLLKQIIRNVRGMTFRELVPKYHMKPDGSRRYREGEAPAAGDNRPRIGGSMFNIYDNTPVPVGGPVPPARNIGGWDRRYNVDDATRNAATIDVKEDGNTVAYMPGHVAKYEDFTDIATPLSTSELESLRLHGYCRYKGKYYTPHRLPEWLGIFLGQGAPGSGYLDNADLYMTNDRRLTALRNQGQYPSAFLTNGVVADDLSAARLTEHCNAKNIDPRFFTWEMRKNVFIPLELDVMDITRLGDVQHYSKLSEILNSFGTGLYQGMNLTDVFDELNKGYRNLKSDVPLNMLAPFTNVTKLVQLPATPSAPRRTFANEEVMRLFIAADDVLRIIAQWYMTAGVLDSVSFADYRAPKPDDKDYYKQILGNRPDAQEYGERVFGQKRCPPGFQAAYFTGPPSDRHRRMLPPGAEILPGGGLNPDARHMECVPVAAPGRVLINDPTPPVVTGGDVVMAAVPDDRDAGQKRTKKHKKSKSKK